MVSPPSPPSATPNSNHIVILSSRSMARASLAPLVHHKKIFHIIEIHNHCDSKDELQKNVRRHFSSVFHERQNGAFTKFLPTHSKY